MFKKIPITLGHLHNKIYIPEPQANKNFPPPCIKLHIINPNGDFCYSIGTKEMHSILLHLNNLSHENSDHFKRC